METATPGVKSTADGWLNRYLQARHAEDGDAVPRRRADAAAAAHAAGHGAGARDEPDRAVRHPRRPGAATRPARRSKREYAAAADRVLNGTGREAFDAIKMLKSADPSQVSARATAPTIRAARSARR